MLMYRFAMEVDKARNSLDQNVRAETGTGDHIVTTVAHHLVLKHPIPDGTQLNEMGEFGRVEETGNIKHHHNYFGSIFFILINKLGFFCILSNFKYISDFHAAEISSVSVLRNAYAPQQYGGVKVGYGPYDESRYWEMRQGYYESLMASSYALQLRRIYGVLGSEYTGYLPNDLNIPNSGEQKIPQYHVSLDVSSTASSTEHQTGVLGSGQINNSTLGRGYIHGEHISEKGMWLSVTFHGVRMLEKITMEVWSTEYKPTYNIYPAYLHCTWIYIVNINGAMFLNY